MNRGDGMKPVFILLIAALSVLNQAVAIETEPDWAKRFDTLKQQLEQTIPPLVGTQITIVRRVGGEITGKVTALSDRTITIDDTLFYGSQLTPASCEKIFPKWCATQIATKMVLTEQAEYDQRLLAENRRVDMENRQLAAQRKANETAAKLKAANPQSFAMEHKLAEATPLQPKLPKQTMAITPYYIFILLGIAGLLVYLIPSMIALKRGHPQTGAICALNLLLGWSLLGWVASLIWALTKPASTKVNAPPNQATPVAAPIASQNKKMIIKKRD